MQGQPSQLIRFDFTRVESIQLGDQGPYQGLNGIALQLNGPEDIVQKFGADGSLENMPAVAGIATSLTVDQVTEAVTALRKICPKP